MERDGEDLYFVCNPTVTSLIVLLHLLPRYPSKKTFYYSTTATTHFISTHVDNTKGHRYFLDMRLFVGNSQENIAAKGELWNKFFNLFLVGKDIFFLWTRCWLGVISSGNPVTLI